MAKRPSKHLRPPRPLSGLVATATRQDGDWLVQTMPAAAAAKPYVCPGCQQTIPPGIGHVVVWPVQPGIGSTSAVEDRRHWHTACWNRRR